MMNLILAAALAAAPAPSSAAPAAPAAAPLSPGARLMAEERYREAIPALERELRADPGAPGVLLNLGWAYWHSRRLDDAWRVATTLVKLDPANRTFLIFMANTSIERRDYARAIALMKRALTLTPDDHDAMMVLARALFLEGREAEALKLVERLLAARPGDATAAYRRAVFLSGMGRKREALEGLEELLKSDPENVSYRRNRARILADLGRQEEAKSEWSSLTRGRLDAQSLMNLGWAHWRERNLDAAWEIALTLVKLDDKNPAFLRFMANLELDRRNYDNALTIAEKAVRLAPADLDASLTLAAANYHLHRVTDAMSILSRLIAAHPDNISVQYRWAEVLAGRRRYKEALSYFDRLVKADPNNEVYRMNRATVLYEMGRFDDGLAEWEARASLEVPDARAVRQLRDDAMHRRSWEDAVEWQMKLIAADPRDPAGWEQLSAIYVQMKMPSKALWAAERAITVDPMSFGGYFLRAEILEGLGDWDEAIAAYKELLRLNPNSAQALNGLSYVLEGKGDFDGALRQLSRIEEVTAPSVSPYLEVHRARLLVDSGRYAQAQQVLDRLTSRRQPVIPALLYHGISPIHRGESIPIENFRAQMRALKAKGYQAITASELARVMAGKADLPEKPILITFDDARTDSFDNADPVLKEVGFRATMFVHVSRLRRPYFHASSEEIARWSRTGRWEIQSHGTQAHDPMLIDPFGRRGHFLPNRRWLPAANRLETLAEFHLRIEEDFVQAKRGVEAMVPGHRVLAFAFPFGDYGQNDYSNTPEAAGLNQALVKKTFQLAFVQAPHGVNTLDSNPTDLKRFSVPRHMKADALVSHLVMGEPWVQAKLVHAQLWMRAGQLGRANEVFEELEAAGIEDPRLQMERAVLFQRGGDISYARSLFSQVAAAEAEAEGAPAERTQRRLAQASRAAAPTASAEVQHFRDSDRNEISRALLRGGGVVKAVRLEGWVGQGEYTEEPEFGPPAPLVRSREGGVQARWFVLPALELSGFYARREFSLGGTGFADNYALAAAWQARPSLGVTLRDGLGNVETAAAIRSSRKFHTNGGGLIWDPVLTWRLNADYDQTRYNDSNRAQDVRLRATKRFSHRVAVGAAYYHGESTTRNPDYYTPRRVNQYSGLLTLNDGYGEINPRTGRTRVDAMLQYEGGRGYEERGARTVHSLRGELGLNLLDNISVRAGGQYSESPTYISRRADGALVVTF
ncbi:MAG: tetratricopeptide repeat protein [Elusimicrobiota bacterium]|nr:tetratricopeptide repeat protein [Elusimicrobiota bacterium]